MLFITYNLICFRNFYLLTVAFLIFDKLMIRIRSNLMLKIFIVKSYKHFLISIASICFITFHKNEKYNKLK